MTSQPAKPLIDTPHRLDQKGRMIGVLLGSLFFPSGALLKMAFQPYIHLDTLSQEGMNLATLLDFNTQLNALGPSVLLNHIFPILLVGVLVSLLFLFLCGLMGQTLTRVLRHTLL